MGRVLVRVVLVGLILLELAYLLRRPLLEPWLRGSLESALGAALDARVTVGRIGGNWLGSVQVEGIQIESTNVASPVPRVVDGSVTARLRLDRLLAGDLAGLRAVRVQARSAHVRVPAASGDAAVDGGPAAPPALRTWLDLAPEGASVDVAELVVGDAPHVRTGPLQVTLDPGRGARRLEVSHAGTSVTVRLWPDQDVAGEVRAIVHDAGALAAALGVTAEATGGTLRVGASFASAEPSAAGTVLLAGLRVRDREVRSGELHFRVAPAEFAITHGAIELDTGWVGLRTTLTPDPKRAQLSLELALGEFATAAFAWRTLWLEAKLVERELTVQGEARGLWLRDLAADVDRSDVAVFATATLRPDSWLPVAARARAGLTTQVLVEGATLPVAVNVRLDATGGETRVVVTRGSTGPARVEGELVAPVALADLCSGAVALTGTPVDGRLVLRELELEAVPMAWRRALELRGLVAGEVQVAGAWPELRGRADLRLRGVSLRPAAQVSLQELAGELTVTERRVEVVALTGVANGGRVQLTGHLDTGPRPLWQAPQWGELQADLTAREVAHPALPGRFDLELHARGQLPEPGAGERSLRVAAVADSSGTEGWPRPAHARAVVTADRDGVTAREVVAQSGDSEASAELRVHGDFAQWFAAGFDPAATRLTGRVDLRHLALADLPVDRTRVPSLAGTATGSVELDGMMKSEPPYALARSLELALDEVALGMADAPPITGLRLRARATPASLQLQSLAATVGGGSLTASGSLQAPAGTSWWQAPLQDPIELDLQGTALDLGALTAPWLATPLAGTARVAANLRGTLATPAGRLETEGELRDAAARLGAWPPDFSVPPAGPLTWSVVARGDADSFQLERARVAAGSAIGTMVVLELHGGLPVGWSAAAGWVAAERDTAIEGRLTAQLAPGGDLPDAVEASVALRADRRAVRADPLQVRSGTGTARGALTFHLGLADLVAGRVTFASARTEGTIELGGLALEAIPRSVLALPVLEGKVTGTVVVAGTVGAGPLLAMVDHADVELRAGTLKLEGLPRFEQVSADVRATAHRVELLRLDATMGAGPIHAQGQLDAGADRLWDPAATPKVTLELAGKDLLLLRDEGLKLRAQVELRAEGPSDSILVSGTARLQSGKYVRRIKLLPDLRARGAGFDEGFVPFRIAPPFGDRIRFDVALNTERPFDVSTGVFDADLDGDLHLRGPATAPYFVGVIRGRKGVIRLPGANLVLQSLLVSFGERDPRYPEVIARAEGRRLGFQIQMSVRGSSRHPEIEFTSVPPLPPEDLIVLVTTGQLPSTLRARGVESQAGLVGSYFAREILDAWFGSDSTEKGESWLDRITFESGREISKNGLETLLVELELSDRLALQAERDVYEDYNMGVVLRFRFK